MTYIQTYRRLHPAATQYETYSTVERTMRGAMSIGAIILLALLIGTLMFALWHTWQVQHAVQCYNALAGRVCT